MTAREPLDSPWKDAIRELFSDFLGFAFPALAASWDSAHSPRFADKELRAISRASEVGGQVVDQLVELTLRDGTRGLVLLHVEVQAQRQAGFLERLYAYAAGIYLQWKRPVATLAVLCDGTRWSPPEALDLTVCGVGVRFEPRLVKLASISEAELRASDNPFALVALAHRLARESRGEPERRYETRLTLMRLAATKGWSAERVRHVLRFMEWVLHLPAPLEAKLYDEVMEDRVAQESKLWLHMEAVFEERLRSKHEAELQQSRLDSLRDALREMLELRFPDRRPATQERVASLELAELEAALRRFATALSWEDVWPPDPEAAP